MKMHRFKESMTIGQLGEKLFADTYKGQVRWAGGREYDFDILLVPNGKTELKTDDYSMHATPNFFIEVYSDHAKQTPGGPYSAFLNNVDYFVYMYYKERKLFVFNDLMSLIADVDYYVKGHGIMPTLVKNAARYGGTYYTMGHKIPREAVKHLYKEIELGDRLPI